MPPSDPPTAKASLPIPNASRRRHWARAWSRTVMRGNARPYGLPVTVLREIGPLVP